MTNYTLMANRLKQYIEDAFRNNYLNKEVNNTCNRERFAVEIQRFLSEFEQNGYIQTGRLAPVRVYADSNNSISVDIMSAFRNLSKDEQEALCCSIWDIPRESVSAFIYNGEGYIRTVELKEQMKG